MKRILFVLSMLAVLAMATTVLAGNGGPGHWKPFKIIVGAADNYVWQPYNARNESYIEQTGMASTAFVNQMNDQSFSWIDQSTSRGTDFASVFQNSPCCYLSYTVHQWPGHRRPHHKVINTPLFTSDWYQNTSFIFQGDDDVVLNGGRHGGGHHGYFKTHAAFVYQWGDGNYSQIVQTGSNDLTNISQVGGFNVSFIKQDGRGPNVAGVTQMGDLNFNDILQDGGINNASVYQNGFGNASIISQTDSVIGFYGHGHGGHGPGINTAAVVQMGYMNDSVIVQNGGGVHSAYVTQSNSCFTAQIPSCAGAGCR